MKSKHFYKHRFKFNAEIVKKKLTKADNLVSVQANPRHGPGTWKEPQLSPNIGFWVIRLNTGYIRIIVSILQTTSCYVQFSVYGSRLKKKYMSDETVCRFQIFTFKFWHSRYVHALQISCVLWNPKHSIEECTQEVCWKFQWFFYDHLKRIFSHRELQQNVRAFFEVTVLIYFSIL